MAFGKQRRGLGLCRAACQRALAIGAVFALGGCSAFQSNPWLLLKAYPATDWARFVPSRLPEAFAPDFDEDDYDDLFDELPLGLSSPPCHQLRGLVGQNQQPLFVVVHGLGGEWPEWRDLLPVLAGTEPAGILMFRWSQYEKRDTLALGLAAGLSRLAECGRQNADGPVAGPVVVLAHSAGGVLASLAMGHVVLPALMTEATPAPEAYRTPPDVMPLAPVTLVTIASPLSGYGRREGPIDGSMEYSYMQDLGTSIVGYPPAAPGVRVVHLRTQYPADAQMQPGIGGHEPNRRDAGVPGALRLTLPDTWGHTSSLQKVVRAIGEGRWRPWRELWGARALAEEPKRPPLSPSVCTLREDVLAAGDHFEIPDFDDPPDPLLVEYWDGATLPPFPPDPDRYIRCRPCDCVSGTLAPWQEWEAQNRTTYEALRHMHVPYPVVIVPGFYEPGVMAERLRNALALLRLGWVGAIMLSGGHRAAGFSYTRHMLSVLPELAAEEAPGLDLKYRILIEPCATEALTSLRNGLRMMGALGLPYGLLLLDSKMSMQSHVFYSQLEDSVPEELKCRVGRVSYLQGYGPWPRLSADTTACHPLLTWMSNPIAYALPLETPAVFWVSPRTWERGRAVNAKDCFGGDDDIKDSEPDDESPWYSECKPPLHEHGLACP